MNKFLKAYEIIRLLGPKWAIQRLMYAIKVRTGILKCRTPIRSWEDIPAPEIVGKFFSSSLASKEAIQKTEEILNGRFTFFFQHTFQMAFPPNWFENPFEKRTYEKLNGGHWSRISDFGQGDIKCIWELSRFAWVYPLVQAYAANRDESHVEAFWDLIEDWVRKNTPNQGVHWKCGQEIAIRMMAVATAYFVFQASSVVSDNREQMLRRMIFASAERIDANIDYALSQNNNHGVSETAGLFTAGILFDNGRWIKKGRKLLEVQVGNLIYDDGSFSQHSANYHRVMLQACLWAVALGRANGIEFSDEFIQQLRKAGQWLLLMADPKTGRMPNLGANDGALMLPLAPCDYEDYRPTIQAAGAVVDGSRWLDGNEADILAKWLVPGFDSDEPKSPENEQSVRWFPDGGYAVLRSETAQLIFRCPKRFRHRPSQCDLLHVDLWKEGVNLLRDAGTYSYNCPEPWQHYFSGVEAHNTIQFDDQDQMPKLSRFLYGKWPRVLIEKDAELTFISAEFKDWRGRFHRRRISTTPTGFQLTDTISGFINDAVLRWRLTPELNWRVEGDECIAAETVRLNIRCTSGRALKLTQGWESRFYQNRQQIPVLEVTVPPDCSEISTQLHLK